jgi:hypothetical protein
MEISDEVYALAALPPRKEPYGILFFLVNFLTLQINCVDV